MNLGGATSSFPAIARSAANILIVDATGGTAASLGVGVASVNASAKLEVASTTQGVLLPRMTKAQRDAIASPVAGLMVYQTDNTAGLRMYNGTNWMRFTETID
jgi:hypothetical protein